MPEVHPRLTPGLTPGTIYVVSEPEYVGRMPTLQESHARLREEIPLAEFAAFAVTFRQEVQSALQGFARAILSTGIVEKAKEVVDGKRPPANDLERKLLDKLRGRTRFARILDD